MANSKKLDSEHIKMTRSLEYEDGTIYEEGDVGRIIKDSSPENYYIVDIKGKSRHDVPRDAFKVLYGLKDLDRLEAAINSQRGHLKFLEELYGKMKKELDKKNS